MRSIAKFGAVSVLNTVVDFSVFLGLTHLAGIDPIAANFVSYSCGVINGFLLSRAWAFEASADAPAATQFVKFAATNVGGLLISSAAVYLFSMIVPPEVAKFMSLPVTFVWSYGISRAWVFAPKPASAPAAPASRAQTTA